MHYLIFSSPTTDIVQEKKILSTIKQLQHLYYSWPLTLQHKQCTQLDGVTFVQQYSCHQYQHPTADILHRSIKAYIST